MTAFCLFLNPGCSYPGTLSFAVSTFASTIGGAILNRNFVALQRAIREQQGADSEDEQALYRATEDTGAPLQQLHALTDHAPDAVRREAAMRLVQVYASYRPWADLCWLGEAAAMSAHADHLRWRVERRNDVAIPAVVAAALSELTSLCRAEIDVESVILEKISTHRLCLIDGRGRREAYWEGETIDVDWQRRGRVWTLLTAVAEDAAHSRQGVDRLSELGISLRDARADLKKLLPAELFRFLQVERGVHQLTLPGSETYFRRFDSRDRLEAV
jgi:hypothetical protein